ncbi:hypothetical protein [Arthrobacter zhaoguopingii]|uniref:hypothetical protein n=1 Tax=Arthrobacter zhaoguopingii TaxID=2681491 RepID=UPI001359CCBF|nr:hypothetical protein [Arthrobacter zhaoguopingii]
MAGEDWHRMGAVWRNSGTLFKTLVVGLPPLGVVLVLIGWRLEIDGAWVRLPFLLNLFSAVVTACFGVPLALVLIRALTWHQEERVAVQEAARLGVVVAKLMNAQARGLVSSDKDLLGAIQAFSTARGLIGSAARRIRDEGGVALDDREFVWKVREAVQSASDAVYQFAELRRDYGRQPIQELASSKDLLETVVRPQVLLAGLPWLPGDLFDKWHGLTWDPFAGAKDHGPYNFGIDTGENRAHIVGRLMTDLKRRDTEMEEHYRCLMDVLALISVSDELLQSFSSMDESRPKAKSS